MILLAEHDKPTLAAKKKQQQGAWKTATSTPKNRVWGFENYPSGRTCSDPDLSAETATGSVQFTYKTASGRGDYYTRDHLGSIREMVASDGSTIAARFGYDPYGRETQISGSISCDFGFAGMYLHATSGLNLTLYRAYNSNTGTWISRDPSGEGSGLNLYEYCANNPIDLTDPSGLDPNPFTDPSVTAPVTFPSLTVNSGSGNCMDDPPINPQYSQDQLAVLAEAHFESEGYLFRIFLSS